MAFPRGGHVHRWARRLTGPQFTQARRTHTDRVLLHSWSPKESFCKNLAFTQPEHSGKRASLVVFCAAVGKRKGEVHFYGNLKRLASSPVNYLCVQAAELDSCEERRVCLVGGLGKKRPLVPWPATVGGVAQDRGARSSAAVVAKARIPVAMFKRARGGARELEVPHPYPTGPCAERGRARAAPSKRRGARAIWYEIPASIETHTPLQGPTQKASLLERFPQSPGRDNSSWPRHSVAGPG